MNNIKSYQIIFEDSYNTKNKLIDIAFKHNDSFSLFRTCDISEKGFYENLKDICIKRLYEIFNTINKQDTSEKIYFDAYYLQGVEQWYEILNKYENLKDICIKPFYEIFNTINKQDTSEKFYFAAHYLQEVEQWYEILNRSEKNELDADSELKLNCIECDLKLLNELDNYLIQKQFTNHSESNMIIGLGEQYFFKSNANTKRILLDNFKSVFDCPEGTLRDLAFYKNGNVFININTNEKYISFRYEKNEENTYRQILEELKKLKGMQITHQSI